MGSNGEVLRHSLPKVHTSHSWSHETNEQQTLNQPLLPRTVAALATAVAAASSGPGSSTRSPPSSVSWITCRVGGMGRQAQVCQAGLSGMSVGVWSAVIFVPSKIGLQNAWACKTASFRGVRGLETLSTSGAAFLPQLHCQSLLTAASAGGQSAPGQL